MEWTVSRVVAHLQTNDRFRLPERQFKMQYAQFYYQRMTTLKPIVQKAAEARWPEAKHVPKVLEIKANESCFIIGTVYANLPLKPNVLDEITQERYLVAAPPRPKYISDKDQFVLEDESGRITLVGDRVTLEILTTGIVMAVFGMQQTGGELLVQDVCYAGVAPQLPLPQPADEAYVVLFSGLQVGTPGANPLGRQLLVDWLTGQVGTQEDQARAAKIVHAIVAGNSLSVDAIPVEDDKNGGKKHTQDHPIFPAEPLLQTDQILSELAESISVDVMPGERDPSNFTLPQQPMYRSLFPFAASTSTFHAVTNPYDVTINGVHFLGTSGQPLDDLYKYVQTEDRLQILEQTLRWRHIAPTAPDTLGCFPYFDCDPFILESTPHVYFVGNQPEFATRLFKDDAGHLVRLILLPSFATSSTAILVDLRTLDVHSLAIRTALPNSS